MLRRWVRFPIYCLAAGLLAAATGELFVRLAVGPPARFLYGSSFRDRQSDFDLVYTVGDQGRRITCAPQPRTPGARRVAVLGDSFAFGQGVEDCQDLVSLLARRAPDLDFENFGRIGAGMDDYLLVARDLLRGFDAVVVLFFGNDVSDLAAEPGRAGRLAGRLSTLALLRRAKNAFVVERALRASVAGSGGDGTIAFLDGRANNVLSTLRRDPESFRRMVEPSAIAVQRFRERFSALAARLDAAVGAENVVVSAVPQGETVSKRLASFIREHGGSVADFGEPGPAHALIQDLSVAHGFRFVDAFPAFRADGDALYHPHDLHWTEAGQRVMAELLSAALGGAAEAGQRAP